MRELSINNFKRQLSVTYKGDRYLVRDNGAVCRQARVSKRMRRLDGVWTFGRQCKSHGYRKICSEVVHKIIATAFYGEQPSKSHVVDHIDTNRRNNRVENLRWVTRLENLSKNEKTLGRIVNKWGSIEEMLLDPNRAEKAVPLGARSWMPDYVGNEELNSNEIDSFTPGAIQKEWRTPSAFPLCPEVLSVSSLVLYFSRLEIGSIFSHNKYGETLVELAELTVDKSTIIVATKLIGGVKNWGLVKIYCKNGKFVHEACGTFFTNDGVFKKFHEALGKVWNGADSIDDFC